MAPWQERLQALKRHHFFKVGLPFLTLVVGGSFLIVDIQRAKYEARADKEGKQLLEEQGIYKRVELKTEADRMAEASKNFEWRNIRGPRPYEDNTEYLSLRESQERNVREALERAKKATAEKKS